MKIIAFCGTSQSGKSTCSNILHGITLQALGITENWRINENGLLEVFANILEEDGTTSKNYNVFNVDDRSGDFQVWGRSSGLWDVIKSFSIAYPLKKAIGNLLPVTKDQLFGLEKETETELLWKQLYPLLDKTAKKKVDTDNLKDIKMSARQVMEYFGTSVLRQIDPDIFVKALVRQLDKEYTNVAVITDVRRLNEAKILKDKGAIIIRLTRGNPANISEADINEIVPDYTIDNKELTIEEMSEQLVSIINEINLFGE